MAKIGRNTNGGGARPCRYHLIYALYDLEQKKLNLTDQNGYTAAEHHGAQPCHAPCYGISQDKVSACYTGCPIKPELKHGIQPASGKKIAPPTTFCCTTICAATMLNSKKMARPILSATRSTPKPSNGKNSMLKKHKPFAQRSRGTRIVETKFTNFSVCDDVSRHGALITEKHRQATLNTYRTYHQ